MSKAFLRFGALLALIFPFVSLSAFALPRTCDDILTTPEFQGASLPQNQQILKEVEAELRAYVVHQMANATSDLALADQRLAASGYGFVTNSFVFIDMVNGMAGPMYFIELQRFYFTADFKSAKVIEVKLVLTEVNTSVLHPSAQGPAQILDVDLR